MYRVVSTPVVFDTLWSLITFGHRESQRLPDSIFKLTYSV